MAGFLAGYLVYDLTHYAQHHFPMRSGYAKYIKRYHMQHHYKDPDTRFGVSSPIWDWVFRTQGGGLSHGRIGSHPDPALDFESQIRPGAA